MGIISRTLGVSESIKTYDLVGSNYQGTPHQLGVKSTPDVEDRPRDFIELERSWKLDPINFNSINKSTQMIMAAGYTFEHKNKIINQRYIDFFENIGDVGEDITIDELFDAIFRNQMIYGNAFVELVFDKETDSKILDLSLVDPKKMDYAKSGGDKIVLDRYGKPVGYTMKIPFENIGVGDKIPTEYERIINLPNNSIFILAKRICHFKLYTTGSRFYGVGLLEPSYTSTIYKRNIEKGQANSIYSRGFNPLIAYVGGERRMATPADIEGVLKKLKKINYNRYEAFPDWVKVEPLEMKQSALVDTTLSYLKTDQCASLGMPMAFASGSGEATNRSTLLSQQRMLEFTLNDIIKRTLSSFKKYILKRLAFYNKFSDVNDVPELNWGNVGAESVDNSIDQIIKVLTAKNKPSAKLCAQLERELAKLMGMKKLLETLPLPEDVKEPVALEKPEKKNDKSVNDMSDI